MMCVRYDRNRGIYPPFNPISLSDLFFATRMSGCCKLFVFKMVPKREHPHPGDCSDASEGGGADRRRGLRAYDLLDGCAHPLGQLALDNLIDHGLGQPDSVPAQRYWRWRPSRAAPRGFLIDFGG